MKKQYIFLAMLFILLYIGYLIVNKTYKEYKTNSHIEYITKLNTDIKNKINYAYNIIEYKNSKAYKNKILKEQQSFKNKGEKVIYLTSEKKYNKFTREIEKNEEIIIDEIETLQNTPDNMNIYEKWIYIIFKKDISL